eukprot:TRINITY_DN580_c1_g1_i3.p1 TRINITY_DN580_c1_g1~~TRINITY_DN580_c1_g1_i3.p1  ORF type:complete len:146 (-),score=31.29 TRINITY_DN580_c1_g1_i3:180-617(-)
MAGRRFGNLITSGVSAIGRSSLTMKMTMGRSMKVASLIGDSVWRRSFVAASGLRADNVRLSPAKGVMGEFEGSMDHEKEKPAEVDEVTKKSGRTERTPVTVRDESLDALEDAHDQIHPPPEELAKKVGGLDKEGRAEGVMGEYHA